MLTLILLIITCVALLVVGAMWYKGLDKNGVEGEGEEEQEYQEEQNGEEYYNSLVTFGISGGIMGINEETTLHIDDVDNNLWNNFITVTNFNSIPEGTTKYLNNIIGNDGFAYSVSYKNRRNLKIM